MRSGDIGEKFFTVKTVANHYFLWGFRELEYEEDLPLIEVSEAFPDKAAEEIVRRCRAALAEDPDYSAFSVNLGAAGWYIVTLLHTDGATVYFSARSIACTDKQTAAYGKDAVTRYLGALSQSSDSGLFIWRVTHDAQFVLTYANPALESLMGLGANSCGKQPSDIFSPAEASFMMAHLSACQTAKKPATLTQYRGACLLSFRLVPAMENGRVKHVFGTVLDITKTVLNRSEIDQIVNRSLHSDQQLCSRVAFSEMLAHAACDLMDTGQSGFDDGMTRLAESIGRIMGVDYVSIVKCADAPHTAEYEWRAHTRYSYSLGTVIFSAAEDHMRQGRMVVSSEVNKDHTSSRHPLFHTILPPGVCSLLTIPVLRGDEVFGAVCLAQYSHSRLWTTAEVTMIKSVAQTIMCAYLRIKTEIHLCEANRVLVEYDESLQDMLAIEETIANVSQSFVVSDNAHFDQCVSSMLCDVSELFDMDAAFLCIGDDLKNEAIYQWSRRGLPHFHQNFKDNEPDQPLWSGLPKQSLAIDNMMEHDSSLPPQINDNMISAGVKSLLCVPLCFGDRILGLLVFCKIVGWHKWSAVQIDAAKTFADIFTGAYRKNTQQNTQNKQDVVFLDIWTKATEHVQSLTGACANTLPLCFADICKDFTQSLQLESVCITRHHHSRNKKLFEWNARENHKQKVRKLGRKIIRVPLVIKNATWGLLYVCFSGGSSSAMRLEMMRLLAQVYVSAYMRIFPDILATNKEYFLEKHNKHTLEPKPVTV